MKTNTDREVLQLALEALEQHGAAYLGHLTEYRKAIAAAKAALAQPTPVAWYDKIMGMEVSMDVSTGEDDSHHRVYGTVYEVMLEVGGSEVDAILAIEDSRNFTSPPQRQPLTIEQLELLIEDIAEWSRYVEVDTAPQNLEKHVRQVLAAHAKGENT
jgi:hypothetical protein